MALAGRHASRVRMRHATRRWRRGKHRAGRCGAGRRGAGRRGASSRGVGRRGARRGGPCGGRGAPGGLASCREVRWHVASYFSTHPSRPSPHCKYLHNAASTETIFIFSAEPGPSFKLAVVQTCNRTSYWPVAVARRSITLTLLSRIVAACLMMYYSRENSVLYTHSLSPTGLQTTH